MAIIPIDLDWHLDTNGYALKNNGAVIVAKGGKLRSTRPLEGIDGLFKVFANIKTPNQLLDFVTVHGLLHDHLHKREWIAKVIEKSVRERTAFGKYSRDLAEKMTNKPSTESVSEHLSTTALFREIMLQSEKGWKRVSKDLAFRMSLYFDREELGVIGVRDDLTRGFRPTIVAKSLLTGLCIQLAMSVSGGAAFRSCSCCGGMFEVGGQKPNRRADSKFCSTKCRVDLNSRQRTKEFRYRRGG